jgi:type IV pilus assembly protein PilC
MANWKWEGFNREGKKVKGIEDADSEADLKRILRGKGIRPIKTSPPSLLEADLGKWLVENGYARPFGNKELINFTRQLSVMVNAGVPILQCLEILFKQEKHPVLKRSIKKIAADVGNGKTLSDALEKQTGFSKLYCNLVRAGETGGILDIILKKLSEYMEIQQKIKKQIKSAMTYPGIVTVIGMAVIYGMMVFVVPKFTDMIKDTGQEVPTITRLVIEFSDFLQEYTMIILPIVFVTIVILSKLIKTESGKPIFDRFMMALPLIGNVIIKGNLASFLKTLSTMLSSGISLIDSLEVCSQTIDNVVITRDVMKVRKAITEGSTLTEPISQIPYFPEMVAQMIRVGEQTGNLDMMMEKVASLFEEEVNDLISNLTKMLEPIILVVLGGFIAVILVAMYLPIFMSAGGAG